MCTFEIKFLVLILKYIKIRSDTFFISSYLHRKKDNRMIHNFWNFQNFIRFVAANGHYRTRKFTDNY